MFKVMFTLMGEIKNLFHKYRNITLFSGSPDKDSLYFFSLLISIIVLSYIAPTIILLSPSGTDVYTHMYNTQRMADSISLFEFYEKSFEEEYGNYDYPFGLWFFGSIVVKVTGMNVDELAYIFPLVLKLLFVFVFYMYAYHLLRSQKKAILASIFLISMPLMTMSILQFVTRSFILIFLLVIVYLSINEPGLNRIFIACILIFSLVISHTGTYMFLMFFSISYFILSAFIWKKFDKGMYILIVSLLLIYVLAIYSFPHVQPQYIDKGRTLLSISRSISSILGLEFINEASKIFYDRVFVGNNIMYVIFWSSLIFTIGRLSQLVHLKIESVDYKNYLALPIVGSIKNVSHSIIATPFWIGPVHTLLSVFGVFKLDAKGKCIALSLFLSSVLPGAMGSDEGTGALKEIYYLYLIVPITSVIGFYYIFSKIEKYDFRKNKLLLVVFFLLVFLPLVLAPIIGNLYYQPTISGTKSEKENLMWLSRIGTPNEGVPGFAYRERIDLYANKITPSIPYGSETRRYLNDLKNTYFTLDAEEYTEDLYSFNFKYVIFSDRILKGFGEPEESLRINSNKQLDKIFASDKNFGIYRYITSPVGYKNSSLKESGLEFEEPSPELKDFGSMYLVENDFYKVQLGKKTPGVRYIGTKTQNMLGEGGLFDYIRISWSGAYKEKHAGYNLKDLKYYSISTKDNEIIYKTELRDPENTEYWATLIIKYTFYEKAVKREITVANDWVNLISDMKMRLFISSSVFAPVSDFEFNQIGYGEEKSKTRKIYPSQDAVILDDIKFNELYLNESGTGLFVKYIEQNPFPSTISYRGSTIYEYGSVSVDSTFSLFPSETVNIVQYFSVGDKFTAKNNLEKYTSFSLYMYPDAKIPVILTGRHDEHDTTGYSSNTYNKFKYSGVTYNEGITPKSKDSLQKEVKPMGYASVYENREYKSKRIQEEEINRIKNETAVNGVLFRSFKYNLDTIKILSDNNILFAQALRVPSPFLEFFREGLRHPKIAYYHGEKTGVVLIPITSPSSSLLRSDYEVEKVFSQWKETLDSVVEDGGVAAFSWNAKEIGDPEYIDNVMEVINHSMNNGMTLTTPYDIAYHFIRLDKIHTKVTSGVDNLTINTFNHNQEEVKGITYRMDLPAINNTCPYEAINARIPGQKIIKGGKCRIYVIFDIIAGGQKEIRVEPEIPRKEFELDFSDLYEGRRLIKIRDNGGNPVSKARVYVDASLFETDQKGEVELEIRRGIHKITVEKPGFVSKYHEIEIKGRIHKLPGYFEKVKFMGNNLSIFNLTDNFNNLKNRTNASPEKVRKYENQTNQ